MYSQLYLPHSIVVYCASITTRVLHVFPKGNVQELVGTGVQHRYVHTHRLEIPLGRAGLLLKLLSLSFSFLGAFLFRARSTLFSLSLRMKH